jgi:YVTN family beta-propeller protein
MRFRFIIGMGLCIAATIMLSRQEQMPVRAQGTGAPVGIRLYVANSRGVDAPDEINVPCRSSGTSHHTVAVVDPTLRSPWLAATRVGGLPEGMAQSPDGERLYVTSLYPQSRNDDTPQIGTLTTIDTATHMAVGEPIKVGANPKGLVVSRGGTRIYVANEADNTVSVIDTDTNTGLASISVGRGPNAVALSPDGARLYVTNSLENTLSVIDTTTNTATHRLRVGRYPHGIALSPDGSRIYVANLGDDTVVAIEALSGRVISRVHGVKAPIGLAYLNQRRLYVSSQFDKAVSIVDTISGTVVGRIAGAGNSGMPAINPADGKWLYVPDQSNDSLSIVDTTSNRVSAIVPVSTCPNAVLVSPDGTFVYVLGFVPHAQGGYGPSGIVQVVSPALARSQAVLTMITVRGAPTDVAVSQDGTRAYVTSLPDTTEKNETHGMLSVIDTATDTVMASVLVGKMPRRVAVSPDGSRAYVSNSGGTISVVDTATFRVVSMPHVGKDADGVALSPNGRRLYVTDPTENSVAFLDTISNQLVGESVTVGKAPSAIKVSNDGSRIYVANQGDRILPGTISAVSTATAKLVAAPITIGQQPNDLAVSPDNQHIYVVNTGSNSLSTISASTLMLEGLPIGVGTAPRGVAVSRDGSRVYVTNAADDTISVIDPHINPSQADAVLFTIPIGVAWGPSSIAVRS